MKHLYTKYCDRNMKSVDKEIHNFMFCSFLFAKTWIFLKIVFGYVYAQTQFEFSIKLLSRIQYALYKTPWKTYLFLHFQMSTLTIRPIFDVTKITVFLRASHNANSPLCLLFTLTMHQYHHVHKRSRYNSSCVSRDSSWSRPFEIWVFRISTVTWNCRACVLLHALALAF